MARHLPRNATAWLIVLGVIAAALVAVRLQSSAARGMSATGFTSPALRYSVELPVGWRVKPDVAAGLAAAYSLPDVFTWGDEELGRESATITVVGGRPTGEWPAIRRLSDDPKIRDVRVLGLVEVGPFRPEMATFDVSELFGVPMRGAQVAFRRSRDYVITLIAPAGMFEARLREYRELLASMRFA